MQRKTNKNGQPLKVAYINTDKLIPYTNNSRTHSPEQVQQIAGSIREFGFTNPILIDEENGIIAGHGRIMAATLLNLKEVPTIILTGLSETQRKAYILADNKLALNAGWNIDLITMELQGLKEIDYDISIIGFDEKELNEFFDEFTDVGTGGEPIDKEEFLVVIECTDEQQQAEVFEVVEQEGWSCKIMN
tara:strand:- start:5046 stop:5615 length:570 start_codon:yes stop_codon:yes gene_type:complete